MSAENHGVVSREQAERMWLPHGERAVSELDAFLDPDTITPYEAVTVMIGAEEWGAYSIQQLGDVVGVGWEEVQRRLGDMLTGPRGDELRSVLVESNTFQYGTATLGREKYLRHAKEFGALLCNALGNLSRERLLTEGQVELMRQRILAEDGSMRLQYTPMTMLEYTRLYTTYDKQAPVPGQSVIFLDMSVGIITSAAVLDSGGIRRTNHSKIHEQVHVAQGMEIWDMTRDDGWRRPVATAVGVYRSDAPIDGIDKAAPERASGTSINEAWTDLVAQVVMKDTPGIKSYCLSPSGNVYSRRVAELSRIRANEPQLFTEISRAVLVEASPVLPDSKREAVDRMDAAADRLYGETASLGKLFEPL